MNTQFHMDDEVLGKAYDSRLMKRLLKYMKPYFWLCCAAFLLVLALTALMLAGPYLIGLAIDEGIRANNWSRLRTLAFIYMVVELVRFITVYAQGYLLQVLGQKIIYDLRMEVFTHLQAMSMRFFDKNPVGRLVTRLTNDIEALNQLFSAGLIAIFGDLFMITGIAVVLLVLHFKLALITLSVIPLLIYSTLVFKKLIRKTYRESRKRLAKINAFLQENISGIKILQMFNREERNRTQFNALTDSYTAAMHKTVTYYSYYVPVVTILSSVSIAFILYYGSSQVIRETLKLGFLVAFIAYTEHFFFPIRDLSEKYNILQAAMASAERIFNLLDTENDASLRGHNTGLTPVINGEIEFRNVSFRYEDEGDKVLKAVSFNVEAGQTVAIVGATGAGKSTIINLIGKYYPLSEGEILVDGTDIRKINTMYLRKHIGIVLQDVFIFSGTIADNIRLRENSISHESVTQAARTVNADRFIEKYPDTYDHEVRERGSSLSVGQKQLLSFARALAYDPRILILDEATASVDTETEILIQDALKKLIKNRTSIIIAHRLSTIQNADNIIVLHKGSICEMGNHQQLLENRGIYHTLYELQYRDQVKYTEKDIKSE